MTRGTTKTRRQGYDWKAHYQAKNDALVSGALGYATQGDGLSGGSAGKVFYVTNLNDSGPGSLRDALTKTGPRMIVAAVGGTIELQSEIYVNNQDSSNFTLFGQGLTVRGFGLSFGLSGAGLSNFIISRVKFEDVSTYDCIQLVTCESVWIRQCEFSDAGSISDEALGIVHGSDWITVTGCHFHDFDKVMLVGGTSPALDPGKLHITLANNWFQGCVQRMPRLSYGQAHLFNNLIEDWTGYVIGLENEGAALSDFNVYKKGVDTEVVEQFSPTGGYIGATDDEFENGAVLTEATPENAPIIPYSYDPISATLVRDYVTANVGPSRP